MTSPYRKACRLERVRRANILISVIATTGRRFFFSRRDNRVAHFEMDDRGRIWFVDAHSNKRIYTHGTNGRWRGFGEGGTLRSLVCDLRDYILKKPHRLSLAYPTWYSDGDPWGYGQDMQKVRDKADELGINYRDKELAP